MEIVVDRKYKKDTYTIGIAYIDGKRFSETMEDKDRGLTDNMTTTEIVTKKIYGQTAIPTGKYEIELTYSTKFASRVWGKKYKGQVPLIINVKGFSGVRIHPANQASELSGCIAPGYNKKKGMVLDSTKVYYNLMDNYILPAIKRKEKVYITIK